MSVHCRFCNAPPNKDWNGELSAEGIVAELIFGETGIAWIGISRHCHAPHTVSFL